MMGIVVVPPGVRWSFMSVNDRREENNLQKPSIKAGKNDETMIKELLLDFFGR